MKARWYDPAIGRFISPDTIVPDPANPQSFNRFLYTLNNPVRYTDPTGHACYDPGVDAATPGNCNGSTLPLFPSSRVLETWEWEALVQAVFSETQNGSYPDANLEFVAWNYLNRISSGKWANMGTAVYSPPPEGYDEKGNPIFGAIQSAIGYVWLNVRDTWTVQDVPEMVQEAWATRSNPNWESLEDTARGVYERWLHFGAGSAEDPTNGGYNYASLTRNNETYNGMSREDYDALVVGKTENFQNFQSSNPDFQWGFVQTFESSGQYKTFFSGNYPCVYFLSCGQ